MALNIENLTKVRDLLRDENALRALLPGGLTMHVFITYDDTDHRVYTACIAGIACLLMDPGRVARAGRGSNAMAFWGSNALDKPGMGEEAANWLGLPTVLRAYLPSRAGRTTELFHSPWEGEDLDIQPWHAARAIDEIIAGREPWDWLEADPGLLSEEKDPLLASA
jgi:hypothetical protein